MTIGEMAGFRVLLVEDEMLIAIEIEDTLKDFGCEVVGPTGKLETALQLATDEMIDAAILDVTIRGGEVFPVAEKLLERGIPFMLASGYGEWALPDKMRDRPRLTKPFTSEELHVQIRALGKEAADRKRLG
ncbi:response regulator (plasmid) [Mesorhizobium sp. AR02]|uniref:response regulator n=1 Tax=Mesorhizobium sp. AR02 TaxID=2865837 RepID=UPI002160EF08|nr:response regulator [Mesorhizobium sp. AR02]UVK57449.1 response regulator [Mesorhizobium sp. AR02]